MIRLALVCLLLSACGDDGGSARPDAAVTADAMDDAMIDAPVPMLTVQLDQTSRTVPRAIGVEVDVTVVRANVTGDVAITVAGLPTGVTADPLTIAAADTTGTLVLWLTDDAATPAGPLAITATAADATATASLTLAYDDNLPGFDASWTPTPITATRDIHTQPGFTVDALSSVVLQRNAYDGTVTSHWLGLPAGLSHASTTTMVQAATQSTSPDLVADVTATPATTSTTLVYSDGSLRQRITAAITVMQPPPLDTTVGTAGRLAIDGLTPAAADLDSTGRLIGIHDGNGSIKILRYTTAGALDTTWGTDGVATLAHAMSVFDGLVTATDQIVVLGWNNTASYIVRANATGGFDTTFGGGDGIVSIGPPDWRRVRIRGGKFIVVGEPNDEAMIGRYNADGTPDTTFNTTGTRSFGAGWLTDFYFDADNKIVVVGTLTSSGSVGLIARLNTDGTLDTTFDSDGMYTVDPGGFGAVTEATNGDVIAAGSGSSGTFLLRLDGVGAPVATFGTNGVQAVGLSDDGLEYIEPKQVRYTAGNITLYAHRGEQYATLGFPLVARFEDNGSPLTTFGTGGYTWLLGPSSSERFTALRGVAGAAWVFSEASPRASVLRKVQFN